MKAQAESHPLPVPFTPVVLELTLSSQAEVDIVHNVFNNTQIIDAMAEYLGIPRRDNPFGTQIRQALEDAQGVPRFKERGYNKFYQYLCDSFYAQHERQASADKIAGVLSERFGGAQVAGVPSQHYRSPDPFRGRPE